MPQTLEEYKAYVGDRLQSVTEILPGIAMGDFSKRLDIPPDEDEFTELYAGINYMLEDIGENLRERKKAEEQLKESEQRYRDIVELAPDGIVTIDMEGTFTSCNKSFIDITGFSRDEIVGKHFSKVPTLRAKDVPTWIQMFASIIKGKTPPPLEFEWVHKDGTRNWGEVRISLMKRGSKITGVQVITRDISESKKTRDALVKSEGKYRSLVEKAGAGIATSDLDGNFTYVNDALCNMIGFSEKELIGKPFLDFMHPEDREYIFSTFIGAFDDPDKEVPLEFRVIHKGGYVVHLFSKPTVLWAGNDIAGFNAIITDITERKLAEKALQDSEEKFRKFFENEPEYCYMISIDGIILDVNNSALEALQYEKGQLIGKPLKTLYAPESVNKMHTLFKKWKETSRLENEEMTIISKDGTRRTVLLSTDAVKDNEGNILYSVSVQRDITERKKAEEALKESEQKYRSLVENINIGIYRAAPGSKGRYIEVNPAMVEIFGYENKDELLVVDISDTYQNPDDRIKYSEKLSNQGFVINEELHMKRKDGVPIIVSDTSIAIYDDKGEIKYFDGIAEDITERKRAEEALKESEGKFRSLAEQSPNMIFINKKGRIVYANEKCEEIMGYTREEFYSPDFDFLTLIVPDSKDLVKENFSGHMIGREIPPFEYSFITKDGERIEAILTTSLIKYGGETAILGMITDITERKRVEKELQERRDENTKLAVIAKERGELQDWINTFDTFVGKFDPNGVGIIINEAPIKAGGVTKDDVVGKYFPDNKWWSHSEKERARIVECFERARAGLSSRIETNFRSADGTPVPVIFNCQPVMDDDGNIKYITAEGKTIVEETRLRTELQEAKEALEIRVRERTSELVEAIEKLEKEITERKRAEEDLLQSEKLASIGQLAAGMAHEINTPLTNISLITENMMKMTNDPELMKKMKSLSEQRRHASNIVSSLLSFSRKIEPKMKAVKLDEILSVSISSLEKTKPKNVKIKMDLQKNLPQIKADLGQLRRAFTNIIDNAYDAMPKGGELSIKTVKRDEENVEIMFIDKGIGISEEDLEHLFEPFFTKKEVGKGVGLGLSICHGIIEAHKGTISVISQEGKGTTFTITLPEG